MTAHAITSYIDKAGELTLSAFSVVFGNETVQEVATKISNFITKNYDIVFGLIGAISFLSAPIAFTLGLGFGYWAYDKTFTVRPSNIVIKPQDIFETSKNQLSAVVITVASRFLISSDISCASVGFIFGGYVRRILISQSE
jgi:hypothetical protein